MPDCQQPEERPGFIFVRTGHLLGVLSQQERQLLAAIESSITETDPVLAARLSRGRGRLRIELARRAFDGMCAVHRGRHRAAPERATTRGPRSPRVINDGSVVP